MIHKLTLPYNGAGEKTVRVYVPAHEEGETFPVIYMTDGQNIFDEETSAFGCWYTREAVRAERRTTGRAAVIVGIHNDGPTFERTNELTPASLGKIQGPLPLRIRVKAEGELFDDFVVNTVMPAVEEKFPVKTGKANTAFCGSSSGGLQTFYTVIEHSDKFAAGGVFSPAFLYVSQRDLRRWLVTKMRPDMPLLYIYSGAGDRLEKHVCKMTEKTYDFLKLCYPESRMKKVIMPEKKHHETSWEPIFKDFLHVFLSKQ